MNTFIGSPLDQVANGVIRGILRVDLAPGRVGMRDAIQAGCKVHRNNLVRGGVDIKRRACVPGLLQGHRIEDNPLAVL